MYAKAVHTEIWRVRYPMRRTPSIVENVRDSGAAPSKREIAPTSFGAQHTIIQATAVPGHGESAFYDEILPPNSRNFGRILG